MDFGFGIAPSSAINLDRTDLEKFEKVHDMEPDIYKCMACGSCSATCPAGRFTGMSLRKVILRVVLLLALGTAFFVLFGCHKLLGTPVRDIGHSFERHWAFL